MDEAEFDKSEDATPFKLKRAREKGSVARSLDLGFCAALVAAIGFLWVGGSALAVTIAENAARTFASAGTTGTTPQVLSRVVAELTSAIAAPLLTFAGALFALALVLDFVQVGPVFSTTPLKPDFARLNPAKGLKRLLSWRMVIEALKATIKLAVYAAIAWLVIDEVLQERAAAFADGRQIAPGIAALAFRLLSFFALATFLFAVADQLYVRRDFAKRMRMSRREVKREHREREGEPRLRQKRKQLHSEFAKSVRSLRDIPGSDVIITNPVHYAVALKYEPASMDAPVVTARGAGEMAARIKRLASACGVIVVADPPLARALYRRGRIGEEIPSTAYEAVAGHYRRCRLAGQVNA